MKKLIVLSCVVAVLIYLFVGFKEQKPQIKVYDYNEINKDGYDILQIDEEMKYAGNLIVVNRDYALKDEGIADDIILVVDEASIHKGYQLGDEKVRLSQSVVISFQNMIDEARKAGVTKFIINSGYRNKEKQASLYQEMGAQYALPAGYSEHNIGLSLDIGSSIGRMEDAPEGKWLREHAAEFGFILRYPEDKVDITGIQYEPWHFRYVGLPHSIIMQNENWVLEEYVKYIKEHLNMQITVAGKKYSISYYEFETGLEINVPTTSSYMISGDNSDGIIVTLELEGE